MFRHTKLAMYAAKYNGKKITLKRQKCPSACLYFSALRSSKFTGDKEKKAASPSGLTTAAKLDHSCAMQVLQQCIGPRLSQEVQKHVWKIKNVHSLLHSLPIFSRFSNHATRTYFQHTYVLPFQDLGIFNSIVRDVFNGLPRVPYATDQYIMNERSFESLLTKHVSENGLIARPQWMDKVVQLYHLSENNHGRCVRCTPRITAYIEVHV